MYSQYKVIDILQIVDCYSQHHTVLSTGAKLALRLLSVLFTSMAHPSLEANANSRQVTVPSSSKEQRRLHSVIKVIDLLSPPLPALFLFLCPHLSICCTQQELTFLLLFSFFFSFLTVFHSDLPLCSFILSFFLSLHGCLFMSATSRQSVTSHPNYLSAG